jgi:hypothetical protein
MDYNESFLLEDDSSEQFFGQQMHERKKRMMNHLSFGTVQLVAIGRYSSLIGTTNYSTGRARQVFFAEDSTTYPVGIMLSPVNQVDIIFVVL